MKIKKTVKKLSIERKDGKKLTLDEIIKLHVWAEVAGYKINKEG